MNLIFVYGTLLSGFENHEWLLKGRKGARLVGEAKLPGHRIAGGMIPYLTPGEDEEVVIGEVYEVDAEVLADLDRLEGHPRHYTRTPVLAMVGPVPTRVEVYFAGPQARAWAEGQPKIEGGCYRTHRARMDL